MGCHGLGHVKKEEKRTGMKGRGRERGGADNWVG